MPTSRRAGRSSSACAPSAARLEREVVRLRHDSLDPDLIDELARKELSFVEPLDVIILLDGRMPSNLDGAFGPRLRMAMACGPEG